MDLNMIYRRLGRTWLPQGLACRSGLVRAGEAWDRQLGRLLEQLQHQRRMGPEEGLAVVGGDDS